MKLAPVVSPASPSTTETSETERFGAATKLATYVRSPVAKPLTQMVLSGSEKVALSVRVHLTKILPFWDASGATSFADSFWPLGMAGLAKFSPPAVLLKGFLFAELSAHESLFGYLVPVSVQPSEFARFSARTLTLPSVKPVVAVPERPPVAVTL